MKSTPRVGVLGIFHESNDFALGKTELSNFENSALLRGEAVADFYRGGHHTISGFIEALSEHDIEIVPLFAANTTPGPVIAAETAERLWAMAREQLEGAGKLDGILAGVHGAAVSEVHRDMDGWWLTELRQLVGPDMPIIGTLDPHANVSARMLAATDALLPYKKNPHVDSGQRGAKAGELMRRTLAGEIRPVQRLCVPPMLINIEKQHTESPPLLELCQRCDATEGEAGVLDASVLLGFPYADVPEMNSGVQVVADGDAALAESKAIELAQHLWDHREAYLPSLHSPEEAVALARRRPRPVCLLDMGDNIGGGGSGAGTWLLHGLAQAGDLKTFFCIHDPEAAASAIAAGADAPIRVALGGKAAVDRDGEPFDFVGRVKVIPPEQYEDKQARHGGRRIYQTGASALLESEDGRLHVLVTTLRSSPNSVGLMTNCGTHPRDYDVVVAKGVNAPLAAFDDTCSEFIKVNTRGAASADLSHFTYHHRRKPMYPFEMDAEVDWSAALR